MSDIHRSLVQIRLEGMFFSSSVISRKLLFQQFSRCSCHQFLDSLVVRISACHVEGPGSIPGRGDYTFVVTATFYELSVQKVI